MDESSYRSVPMLMNLLEADENLAPLVIKISPHTLYYHLKKSGYDFKHLNKDGPDNIYKRFQADYPNQLWQGDARDGICLPDPNNPEKTKMTYLFGWMDDFSRKFMYARYYWDEKLPRMEDCFRQAVLRWGLPEKIYCDNGSVYISNYFLFLVSDLEIKKIHHRAYSAWCKGKVVMRSAQTYGDDILSHLPLYSFVFKLEYRIPCLVLQVTIRLFFEFSWPVAMKYSGDIFANIFFLLCK